MASLGSRVSAGLQLFAAETPNLVFTNRISSSRLEASCWKMHPQVIHTHHHSPLMRSGEATELLSYTCLALPNDDDDDDVLMITYFRCGAAGRAGGRSAGQQQDADFKRL